MRLILTDYIASLKEDKELDSLIQNIIREYGIEIVFAPKPGGRQYGVDIYAVGRDPKDSIKKVLLITVKQGNLDRQNWQGAAQALEPSLYEIVTVFTRNNILPQHQNLPIKVVVAHNGINEPTIQQNFVGFTDRFKEYEFDIWQLETLVDLIEQKQISDKIFSDNARSLFRKVIIYLFNPDYDLKEYYQLVEEIVDQIKYGKRNNKRNLRLLRKILLIEAIVLSFCRQEDDLRLALKVTEITSMRIWETMSRNKDYMDEKHMEIFVESMLVREELAMSYLDKIAPVADIKDGFSKYSGDSITYTLVAYEHLGFVAVAGLEFLQLANFFREKNDDLSQVILEKAHFCANTIIQMFNNNGVLYNPRLDDHCIELNLCFMLLFSLNRKQSICSLLIELNNQIAHAKLFANVFPDFKNNTDKIFELYYNETKKREEKLTSSCLFTTLVEWTIVLNDRQLYNAYRSLKEKVFGDLDLVLWFPDAETENVMFRKKALPETGYTLSHILLTEKLDDFKEITLIEYQHNNFEKDFFYMTHAAWTLGLVACRHFRTYIFPHYWRQYIV